MSTGHSHTWYCRRHDNSIRRNDVRTPAERDCDRILYALQFRRLAEVTQVVSSDAGSVFHNRLSHSLQVAQVGRRIAERLNQTHKNILDGSSFLDPNVVQAACLAHDIGHPPFGHMAEKELDQQAAAAGGFEGNAQSFRVVTKLAFRNTKWPGLDLCQLTLAGMLKYPWLRGKNPKKKDKWGAYDSEIKDFEFATAIKGDKRTPDAQLMDWADDVTYSVHDMEDFFRAGLIPLHLLTSDRDNEKRAFFDDVKRRHADGDAPWTDMPKVEKAFENLITVAAISEPFSGTQRQQALLRNFADFLIDRFVNAVTVVEGSDGPEIRIEPTAQLQVAVLKELTWTYVIDGPALQTQQQGQRVIIRDLFDFFANNAKKNNRKVFPPPFQARLDEATTEQERIRVAVDHIAGMTESIAMQMHGRITGKDHHNRFRVM